EQTDMGDGLPKAVTWAAFLGVFYGAAELLGGWGYGPMRHAAAGALNLAFHHRPARFEKGVRDVALRPLSLDGPKLGVERPEDWGWNRLLQFDACVQCGRCEAVCPAHDAGQPLNPKTFITSLVGAMEQQDQSIVGAQQAVQSDTIWACTTCRACVYEFPMMIEHVDTMVDLRRYETLEQGRLPHKAAESLEDVRLTGNLSGKKNDIRLDWAADLDVPVLANTQTADVVLFTGQASFELRG